jgi:autotransporter adhesin
LGSPLAAGNDAHAVGFGAMATGDRSTGLGTRASASGLSSVAVGDSAQATASLSTAIGANATATAANSVALGAGSIASAPNTVSVGAPGAERRITNVAPGISPTDAVNVSQLTGLSNQIGSLQQEARRGIAAAVAAGGYLTPSAPGRTTVQVTSGFFHGETAVGITAAHRLNLALPVVVFGSYANAGGSEQVGKVGAGVEF